MAGFDLRQIARTLLGVSAYQPPANRNGGVDLESEDVKESRRANGGQLQRLPTTQLRWYFADLEQAQYLADTGNLKLAARLYRAMRRDGVLSGLLGTRTSGLVRLPKRFYGDKELAEQLKAKNGTRSIFDDMCPPSELALLAADGICLGVGLAELVPVPGRDYPILIRLDPEYLQYRWVENAWYYESTSGLLPITPGDGRWVLHCPGGRIAPWNSAAWPALGRSFIDKEHAILNRMNYAAKLANPARVAVAPIGATEEQRVGLFKRVMAWATDTVFALPVGYDVKLIESNGKGAEVFQAIVDTADKNYMVTLAGQVISTEGGKGFTGEDAAKAIRADLVQDTGDGLAYTVNTQVLPAYTIRRKGEAAVLSGPCVEWNTAVPKDLVVAAQSLTGAAGAITALRSALGEQRDPATGTIIRAAAVDKSGRPIEVDEEEILIRFDVPRKGEISRDEVETFDVPAVGEDDERRQTGDIEAARSRSVRPPMREAA